VPVSVEKTPGPAGSTSDVVACFEAMPAIVWAFEGADLVVMAANAPARASAGNRVGIVGRPIRQVLPELEGQQIFEMMEEAYRAGRVISAVDRRVLVDRNGDGRLEEGFFTYTFVPTFDPEGSVRGLVAHVVETTAQAVRSAAAERAAAASQLRLQEASQVVLELQRSLLPADVPVLPWLTVAGQYRVAGDELAAGGDWFDTVVLPDERVVLLVGDVVGHGARAAGAMGQLRAVLLEALTGGLNPAEALRRVDRFAAREGATRATTVCLVVVNPAGEAMVATRAHPLPLVVDRLGGTRRMPVVKSTPLGIGGPDAEWLPLQLGVGEMLLLFSDGLMERPDRSTGHAMDALVATVAATRRDIGEDGVQPDTSLPTSGVERLATLVVDRLPSSATVTRMTSPCWWPSAGIRQPGAPSSSMRRCARNPWCATPSATGWTASAPGKTTPTRSCTRWAKRSRTPCSTPTPTGRPRRPGPCGCARPCRCPVSRPSRSPTTGAGFPRAQAARAAGGCS